VAQYREGQRLQGSDGNIYVVQGGVPVLANGGAVAVTGGDPALPSKVTKAQNEAAASVNDPVKAASDALKAGYEAKIAAANSAVAAAKNDTDLQIAKANLAKTQAEIGQLQQGKGKAQKALQDQIDRVSDLYRGNIEGGLPNPLWGHIPTSTNQQFDSAAQGLVNPFQASFRIQGQGSQSDTELKQFLQANTPSATDPDKVIEEKLRNIQTRLRRRDTGQDPSTAPPPASEPRQVGLAKGKQRAEIDPALKAVASKVGVMLANGTPGAQIEGFLRQNGVDPASTDLGAKLKYRISPEFKRWQRANPGSPYPIDPSFYTKQVGMTALASFEQVGQSPWARSMRRAAGDALFRAVAGR
jgi:hypothetical protein